MTAPSPMSREELLMNKNLMESFKITKLNKIFAFVPSVEKAMSQF